MPRDAAAVLEDFRGEGIFVLRHVAELFEQRQVAVGFDVAHRAGIAVPVPGAAEVAGALDDADLLEAGFAQAGAHQQAAEAAADDRELDLVEHRLAREARLDVRVFDIAGEFRFHLDILAGAIRAQPAVALGEVFRVQRLGVEVDLAEECGYLWLDIHSRASVV